MPIMKSNNPFLATTAIEDFWDTSYPIVFLGEWCKRYSRKKNWENIASKTLPSYFEENKSKEIYAYLNNVFERLLLVLHGQMNQIHGVNFSKRYWRIVLGSWLSNYIHVMYDRYKNLEHFIKFNHGFTSICLDKKSFIIPKDAINFVCHIREDDYNLQIYSSILSGMGYNFPVKELKIALPEVRMYFTGGNWRFKNILKYICELICRGFQNKRKVFFKDAYFSQSSMLKLMLKTKGVLWPCAYSYQGLPDFTINHKARAILGKLNFGENKFEEMLATLIPLYMPQSAIEGFDFLRKKANKYFISKPKAIMSAICWWFDNIFQVWAAESAEKGAMLLGVQHGGNYGIAANLLQEDIELGIVDKFYSWGWVRRGAYAKVIPMPAPKLVDRKNKSFGKNNGVLYVLSNCPRYLDQIPWSTNYWENYSMNQSLFIANLSKQVINQLRIRPHREDQGGDVKSRLNDLFPQVKIESWNIPFIDSLRNCSVYVSDHPLYSTTFIEALANNKPTIIFYNPYFAANAIRDDAQGIFNLLKNNSIIFDDPKSAAQQLNLVFDSIESWWNEPKRQEAVRIFLDKFGRISSTWLNDWSDEILNVGKN